MNQHTEIESNEQRATYRRSLTNFQYVVEWFRIAGFSDPDAFVRSMSVFARADALMVAHNDVAFYKGEK